MRFATILTFAALMGGGCSDPLNDDELGGTKGDINGDGVQDSQQSFGKGWKPDGGVYMMFFPGPHMPHGRGAPGVVGDGGGKYIDASNVWFEVWYWLNPVYRGEQIVAWTFDEPEEGGTYEFVLVDGDEFVPYEQDGWGDPSEGASAIDFNSGFLVPHYDGIGCPEGTRQVWHYGFIAEDDDLIPLKASIAPEDPTCKGD